MQDFTEINHNSEITVITESWFELMARKKRDFIRNFKKEHKIPKLIAVFGGSAPLPNSPGWNEAYQVGAELAKRGGIIFNGGYSGIMEASAAGARTLGGETIAVTCSNLPPRQTNPYIRHDWQVERWDQRLLALVFLADGYAILPGSSGTLVELSVVIETQSKGFIPERPIACLSRFWEPVIKRIDLPKGRILVTKSARKLAEHILG